MFFVLVKCKTIYEEEERLLKMLLKKAIHPDVLPRVDGAVKVKFGLTLNQIVDVVRKENNMYSFPACSAFGGEG